MMLLRTVHFHVLWDFNVSSPSCVLFWLNRTSVAKCVLRYLVYIDEVICPTILIMDNDHLLSYPQYHVVNYWQGWIVWQRLTWSGRFILYILKKWYQGWMSHFIDLWSSLLLYQTEQWTSRIQTHYHHGPISSHGCLPSTMAAAPFTSHGPSSCLDLWRWGVRTRLRNLNHLAARS